MKSIRKRLLVSILFTLLFMGMIMVALTYYELKEEMDEVFDGSIKQIAQTISVHGITDSNTVIAKTVTNASARHGEEEFLVQIWRSETLFYTSHSQTEFPKQGAGGVRTVSVDGEKWRFYGIAQGDLLIQVSQPIKERHVLIWEIYAELLTPILILIPITGWVIWFFVNLGFKPLSRVSRSIEERSSTFLDKLPTDDVPVEVHTMVKALNGLLERLSNALVVQRQFTANAAHELRTPLTAVRLELDVLNRADSEEERAQSISHLYSAVDRCTRMVQQLLELARQEPNLAQEKKKDVALKPIIARVIDDVSALSKSKSIDLAMQDFDDIKLFCQEHAVETMIGNLVCNAVLYTHEKGKVRVSVQSHERKVMVIVSDNGCGIADDQKEKVFDRFYRVLDTKVDGSGLGLSIVKAIADRHNASICIEDGIDGRGSRFIVTFPNI